MENKNSFLEQTPPFCKTDVSGSYKILDKDGVEMPHNGLYLQPERAEAVVWYSTERAFEQGIKWVSFTYKLSELSAIENEA